MVEQLVDCRPSPLLSVHGLNPALSELRSVHLNEVRLAAQYCSPMIGTLSNPSCFYPTLSNPGCSEVFEAGTRRPSPLSLPHIFTLAAHQPTRPQMLSGKIEPNTALSYTFYSTQKCCPQKNPTWHGSTCMHSTLKAGNVSGFSYFSLQPATEAAPLHWPTTHKSS